MIGFHFGAELIMDNIQQNKTLFQILIASGETNKPAELPLLQNNKISLTEHHPDLRYELMQDPDITKFISAHFDGDVMEAYDTLIPYAYKADLARYCLLYVYGGLYVDLSMRLLAPIVMPRGRKLVCFRDHPHSGGGLWTVSNGLIYADAGRKEFRAAIDMIVQNVKDRYYGATWLHPTGPALFGRATAIVNREEDIFVGEFRCVTNNENPFGMGYVDGTGRLVAVRMKGIGADISHMGLSGTNNYAKLWAERSVYKD